MFLSKVKPIEMGNANSSNTFKRTMKTRRRAIEIEITQLFTFHEFDEIKTETTEKKQ